MKKVFVVAFALMIVGCTSNKQSGFWGSPAVEKLIKNDDLKLFIELEKRLTGTFNRPHFWQTPTIMAIEYDAYKILEHLVKNKRTHFSGSPMQTALKERDQKAIDILKASGVDVLKGNYLYKATTRSEVDQLLSMGVSVNQRNYLGQTALHKLAENKKTKSLLLYLIKKGADVNAKSYTGVTPLHIAAYRLNLEAVEELLDKGADPNAQIVLEPNFDTLEYDARGATPLHLMTYYGRAVYRDSYKWSHAKNLAKVTKINLRDGQGLTPSMLMNYKMSHIAKKELGAFTKDEMYEKFDKPIYSAIDRNDKKAIVQILKSGASINFVYKGMAPLHYAAKQGNHKMVEFLLREGAYPNLLIDIKSPYDFASNFSVKSILQKFGGIPNREKTLAKRERIAREQERNRARTAKRNEVLRKHYAQVEKERQQIQSDLKRQDLRRKQEKQRYEKLNSYIDAFNRGAGIKIYKRHNSDGSMSWYERKD